jgi:hypothetical protein
VRGLREAKAAFQALPEIVREAMLDATETTVREIARGAQARLASNPSIQTRSLYNHIAWKVTKSNGRGRVGDRQVRRGWWSTVGRSSEGHRRRREGRQRQAHGSRREVDSPSRYAHLVEFGSRHICERSRS